MKMLSQIVFPKICLFKILKKRKLVYQTFLEIENFDGDVINWSKFWNKFSSMIHENDSLNEINKFIHLKSFLSDSAKLTILSFCFYQESKRQKQPFIGVLITSCSAKQLY